MLDKFLRHLRSISSGRGEELMDRSSKAVFLLCFDDLPVLVLSCNADGWKMFYTEEFKSQDRVKPLVPFRDVNKVYRARELWPFFSVRIPSIARPEVERTVREEGLDYDDVAAMLSRFGRKSIADPFELRDADDKRETAFAN